MLNSKLVHEMMLKRLMEKMMMHGMGPKKMGKDGEIEIALPEVVDGKEHEEEEEGVPLDFEMKEEEGKYPEEEGCDEELEEQKKSFMKPKKGISGKARMIFGDMSARPAPKGKK